MKNSLYALALVSVFLSGCGHGLQSGTGKKIGQVIQIGQHGLLCKTYEGKLVRGGFNTGSGVSGGVFEFTVDDHSMFAELQKAMESQEEIEVTYQKVSFSGPCTSESDHFVTGFRKLADTSPSVSIRPSLSEKEQKRRALMEQLRALDTDEEKQ